MEERRRLDSTFSFWPHIETYFFFCRIDSNLLFSHVDSNFTFWPQIDSTLFGIIWIQIYFLPTCFSVVTILLQQGLAFDNIIYDHISNSLVFHSDLKENL